MDQVLENGIGIDKYSMEFRKMRGITLKLIDY